MKRFWLILVAAVSLLLGCNFTWKAVSHHGDGIWTFGGDKPGTDYAISTDEFNAVISETQYKRRCWTEAFIFFAAGLGISIGIIREWKKPDN